MQEDEEYLCCVQCGNTRKLARNFYWDNVYKKQTENFFDVTH